MALPVWPSTVEHRPAPTMWAPALFTPPRATEMEGGNVRLRGKAGDTVAISKWGQELSNSQFAEFRAFFRDTLENGAGRLLMPVCLDALAYETCTVQIVSDSLKSEPAPGSGVVVSFDLRVFRSVAASGASSLEWPTDVPFMPGSGWQNTLGTAPLATDIQGPSVDQRSRPGDEVETIAWSRALTRAQFAVLRTFVEGSAANGARRIYMPVTLDRSTHEVRAVQIVAGSFTAAGINNAQVRVTMSLTVYPPSWVPPVPVVVGLGTTVTGTAPAGATVELRVGATLLYGTANAGGAWSIGLPYMEGGTYSVQARIGDGPWSLPQYLTLAAPVYAEATLALFARMTVQPTGAVKVLMDTLVRAIVAAGVWPKLDALHILAAHDAQAARLNWVADQYNLIAVNSPVFTAFRGYTGNGTSSYLNTGAAPAALASTGKLRQNSAHICAWTLTSVPSGQVVMGARTGTASFFDIFPRESGLTRYRPNAPLGYDPTKFATPRDKGFFLGSRNGTAIDGYMDGVLIGSITHASAAPTAHAVHILAQNADGVAFGFCSTQVAMASVGAALTATEAAALHSAVRAYLVGVGAVA